MEKHEIISYAMDFASYLVSRVGGINRIILYGSAARGDFDEESDIDIFLDVSDARVKNRIKNMTENYYATSKFREWKLKGIENNFSVIAGNLESNEWRDLKRAIMNTGIVLYGKYKAEAEKIFQYVIFSIENIKPEKKRVAVYRKLFGFQSGNIKYPGLIEKVQGKKIGKGVIIVPSDKNDELREYLKKKGISTRIYDVWSDDQLI